MKIQFKDKARFAGVTQYFHREQSFPMVDCVIEIDDSVDAQGLINDLGAVGIIAEILAEPPISRVVETESIPNVIPESEAVETPIPATTRGRRNK